MGSDTDVSANKHLSRIKDGYGGLVGDDYINSIAPRVPQLPFGEPSKATPDVDLVNDGGVVESVEISDEERDELRNVLEIDW